MTDRTVDLLMNGSDADRAVLYRRLACGPQPRVRKSSNPFGPKWMVDYDRGTRGVYTWEEAVQIAIQVHRYLWHEARKA